MNFFNTYTHTPLFENLDRFLSGLTEQRQSSTERMSDTDDAFLLSIDLPGLSKENIKTQIENGVLSLELNPDEKELAFVSASTRSWRIPRNIETNAISASLENGVFTLTLPKVSADNSTHTISIS